MTADVFHPDEGGDPLETENLCLPALTESVPAARRAIAKCLSAWDLDDLVFPCAQVVAELAANAVAEAGTERSPEPHDPASGTFTVYLSRTSTHLFVKVGDASREPPKPRTASEEDENGRGLALVEALADHWGWYPNDPKGKVVYAVWNLPGVPAVVHPTEAKR